MRWVLVLGVVGVVAVLAVGGLFLARRTSGEEWQGGARSLPRDRGQPVHYVALGDSTVAGIGASSPEKHYVGVMYARLREVYPQARLTNLGVSGATSADVVRGQLRRAVELRPQLVTLSIGPNDITQGKDAKQYEQNIETIFRTLARETEATVVVNLLPDMAIAPRFTADQKAAVGRQAQLFNDVLRRQGERYGVELVDLYTASQRETPQHPEWLSGDAYHPSDAGYARWAEIMWEGVAARLE